MVESHTTFSKKISELSGEESEMDVKDAIKHNNNDNHHRELFTSKWTLRSVEEHQSQSIKIMYIILDLNSR